MGCIISREESAYVPYYPPRSPSPASSRRLDEFIQELVYDATSEQLRKALASDKLNHVNLIVGIDFSTTNLHTGDASNPYEDALPIIEKLWSTFHEDARIHCYGFGNVHNLTASTLDHDVFSFNINESICNGFEEVLTRYKEIIPHIRISGPVSFAPIIEMAITKAVQIGGQYNVLLIIADSQAFGNVDSSYAIVEASEFPLSIILVAVGDGHWDRVKEFADKISARARAFDNFQLVNFTTANTVPFGKELEFCSALKNIPRQYEETKERNISWVRKRNTPMMFSLPPPDCGAAYGRPTPSAPYFTSDDMPSSPPERQYYQTDNPETTYQTSSYTPDDQPKYSTESHINQSDVP